MSHATEYEIELQFGCSNGSPLHAMPDGWSRPSPRHPMWLLGSVGYARAQHSLNYSTLHMVCKRKTKKKRARGKTLVRPFRSPGFRLRLSHIFSPFLCNFGAVGQVGIMCYTLHSVRLWLMLLCYVPVIAKGTHDCTSITWRFWLRSRLWAFFSFFNFLYLSFPVFGDSMKRNRHELNRRLPANSYIYWTLFNFWGSWFR